MMKLLLAYLTLSFPLSSSMCNAQRSDPSQFNGGSILAMAGRNSVAIAIDARFGLGMQTISTGDSMTVGGHRNINNDDDDEDDQFLHEGGGEETVSNPRILLLPNSNTLMAWTGLFGDGMSFGEELNWILGRKVRKAGSMGFPGIYAKKRMMSPRAITMLISHLLYRRRNAPYYVETVIVGLESIRVPTASDNKERSIVESSFGNGKSSDEAKMTGQDFTAQKQIPFHKQRTTSIRDMMAYRTIQKPYLCGTDMLGAKSTSRTFICSGVASKPLHGTAEALWKPDLDGDKLVEVCGKAFVSALERDILSGYGAVVYLIQGTRGEDDGKGIDNDDEVRITEYVLACRND